MALKYWPLAVLLLLGFVVLGYLWGRRSAPYAADGLLVANTGNVRRVAAFQQLARRLLRWTTIQVASLGLVVAGCWLLAGRLGLSDENPSIQHNRDIMLCLDVSGSMSDVDAELLRGFGEIARGLKGERIGLTVWNSSAVLKFPLTHDYDFIAEQLTTAAQEMEKHSFRFLTGTNEGNGSSLIGDGVMSCLQRFDRRDSERARTMVLATDNDLSGTPIFTVEQAFAQLKEQKVVTFTIAEYDDTNYARLRQLAIEGGGAGYLMRDKATGPAIIRSIQSQEASRLQGERQVAVHDLSAVGLTLLSVGLVGWVVASGKVSRWQ